MSVRIRLYRLAGCPEQTCGTCQGSGYTTVCETSGGIYREYAQRCNACGGTGTR